VFGSTRAESDPAGVGFGDGEAEFFEFGDELAQAAVVVEPGAVVGELVVGQMRVAVLPFFLRVHWW
jgi:hypothetical protein